MFNHIKGKNGITSFLPFDSETGAKVNYIKNKDATCLTEDQTRYAYKKIEQGSNLSIETMRQEIEQEKLAEIKNKENDMYQDGNKTMQMENW